MREVWEKAKGSKKYHYAFPETFQNIKKKRKS
jgi:hypothetical protein